MNFKVGDKVIINNEYDSAFGKTGVIVSVDQRISILWDDDKVITYHKYINYFCRKLSPLEELL